MEATQHDQAFQQVYAWVKDTISTRGFRLEEENISKPWGAYIRLADDDAAKFASLYFKGHVFSSYKNLSPKFLIVAPGKRLSWQKHAKRAELWTVLQGPVGAKLSDTDYEPDEVNILNEGDYIEFGTNVRHRLIGLERWGVVTEIWKHTKAPDLSDEGDIVRIQDDFSR